MSDAVIKQIPNILEDPVIVMQSRTVGRRVTMFGEVYDENNFPVLAVLEMYPTGSNGLALENMELSSAYGKDTETQDFIDKSRILYVNPNKEKTQNWADHTRLQLPVVPSQSGVISKIAYESPFVNMQNSEESKGTQYSIKDDTPTESSLDGLIASTPETEALADSISERLSDGEIAEGAVAMVEKLAKSTKDTMLKLDDETINKEANRIARRIQKEYQSDFPVEDMLN